MTMTDTPTPAPPAKPKTKRSRRAKTPARASAPAKTNELAGLTADRCCTGCGENGCVISGVPFCAHPLKGGLQASMMKPEVIERFGRAKKMLKHAKIDREKN